MIAYLEIAGVRYRSVGLVGVATRPFMAALTVCVVIIDGALLTYLLSFVVDRR